MKALLIDVVHPIVEEKLSKFIRVERRLFPSDNELANLIHDVEILVMRVDPVIDRAIIDRAKKLQVIGVGATGLNHIDLDYAQGKDITVLNVPATNYESVAELTIGRIIDLLRHLPRANNDVKQRGIWNKHYYMGNELAGKILGIVALGRIGSRVAELARAFHMEVLAFDPFISELEAESRGARLVSFEELLECSDIVSLHAPLSKDTYQLINRQALKKMRPGSYLVNMARGELVDEEALYDALKEGNLAGAGADVMTDEPCLDSPFYSLDNFVVTPHIGAQTHQAQYRIGEILSERILQAIGVL